MACSLQLRRMRSQLLQLLLSRLLDDPHCQIAMYAMPSGIGRGCSAAPKCPVPRVRLRLLAWLQRLHQGPIHFYLVLPAGPSFHACTLCLYLVTWFLHRNGAAPCSERQVFSNSCLHWRFNRIGGIIRGLFSHCLRLSAQVLSYHQHGVPAGFHRAGLYHT